MMEIDLEDEGNVWGEFMRIARLIYFLFMGIFVEKYYKVED